MGGGMGGEGVLEQGAFTPLIFFKMAIHTANEHSVAASFNES